MTLTTEQLQSLYQRLFPDDCASSTLIQVRDALLSFRYDNPSETAGPVNALFSSLLGYPVEASANQLRALKQVFTWRELRSINPLPLDGQAPRTAMMRFFNRTLASATPDDLFALQDRLLDVRHYGKSENRAGALSSLRRLEPGIEWDKKHLQALDKVFVTDRRFIDLCPFLLPPIW